MHLKNRQVILLGLTLFLCLSTAINGCNLLIAKPFQLPASAKQEPWPIQTGLRAAIVRSKIPTVNRIVLVPDEATFLAAIQKWNLKGNWPILIEDDKYTPTFLQRFQAEEVVRLPSIKQQLPKGKKLQELMLNAAATAWNATDTQTLKAKWTELGWEPPGVVITSENDPARSAAVALAAAHGQPLVFLEGNFGKPNQNLNKTQWQTLQIAITKAVESTGFFYSQLADPIDTITIVRELAVKYQSPQKKNEQLAVTDGLGRHINGERWAAVGWIYGSEVRSIYQAMCSIFLDSQTAMLYDSYPKEGNWAKYEMEEAASGLKTIGLNVELVQQPESSLEQRRGLASKPWTFDLILMNSKGYPKSVSYTHLTLPTT